MNRRNWAARRLWAAAAFASLLLVSLTAPGLAASGSRPIDHSAAGSSQIPSAQDFSRALALAEREQRAVDEALKAELETQKAARERRLSRKRFANLSGSAAEALLLESFPEELEQLNGDPARVISELEIEKTLGAGVARVASGGGETALIDSSLPIEVGEGPDREQVDLSLELSDSDFVPVNPITDLRLPGSSAGQIRLDGGIAVTDLPGNGDSDARRIDPSDLFYPDTDPDTDTLLAPQAGGVEILEQIRSQESPEQFRFELSLPDGASLSSDGHGGAKVTSPAGGLVVPAPTAVDAQGAEVPTTLEIEGDALLVTVPHQSLDVAYPILLDPELIENVGPGSPALGLWSTQQTVAGYEFLPSPASLRLRANGQHTYPANSFAQFIYVAPGSTAWVRQGSFSSITGTLNANCASEKEPHGYVGIFNELSGKYEPQQFWAPINLANNVNATLRSPNPNPGIRFVTIGVGVSSSGAVSPKCNHELSVGGAILQYEDPEAPALGPISGPTGPIGTGTAAVNVSASDPGFGVYSIKVQATGIDGQVKTWTTRPLPTCNGTRQAECPHTVSGQAVTIEPALLPEGEVPLTITAEDAVGHVSAPQALVVTVERAAPDTLIDSGPGGVINNPRPTFTYHATRSGATFACALDGAPFAACPTSGFTAPTLADGAHTFTVRATSAGGLTDPTPASREFTVDAAAPETTIDFGPEGLISTRTPDFVFSSDDPDAHFECKLDADPFAPCAGEEFGVKIPLPDGPHTFATRAFDQAGNIDQSPATRSFSIDASPPSVHIDSGPDGPINNPSPTFEFTASGGAVGCVIEAAATESEEPNFSSCTTPSSDKPSSPLVDGRYTFWVHVVDAAENEVMDSRSFSIDVVAPETTIDSGPPVITDDASPTFAFSSNEPGVAFSCRFDGQAFSLCSGPGAAQTPSAPLADGPHQFEVRAIDSAGNVDPTPASQTFAVETGAPQTSIDSGPLGATANTSVDFGYSADEPSSFECRLDAATFASCSAVGATLPGLSEGEHRFEVRAMSAGGKVDPTPATRGFIIDTTSPDAPVLGGPLREAGQQGLSLRVEVKDGSASSPSTTRSGVGAIRVAVDGQAAVTSGARCEHHVCPPTAVRDLQVPYQQALGTHHFVVEGEDGVGHFSPLAAFDKTTTADGAVVHREPPCKPGKKGIESRGRSGTIRGTSCDDVIIAGPGKSTIHGNGGDDLIVGGPASNTIFGGEGNDRIFGKRSDDEVHGDGGNDVIYGGIGDDRLFGGEGNDLIDGGPGFDGEAGEEGNDTLRGGQGNDALAGEGGLDTISFADAVPTSTVVPDVPGFPGFPGGEAGVMIDLTTPQYKVHDGPIETGGGDDLVEAEQVIGSSFNDYIKGSAADEEIDGGPGSDFVDGNGGNDRIVADPADFHQGEKERPFQPRDDTKIAIGTYPASGSLERDVYLSGRKAGDDVVANYLAASNTIQFTAANLETAKQFTPAGLCRPRSAQSLTVNCPLGNVRLGAVVISGNGGNDKLSISGERTNSPGAFELLGGANRDQLVGGVADELLVDGESQNTPGGMREELFAGAGDDEVIQGGGADEVQGGPGNDLLISSDICHGDVIYGDVPPRKGETAKEVDARSGSDNAQFHPFQRDGVFADLQAEELGEMGSAGHKCAGGVFEKLSEANVLEASPNSDILKGTPKTNLLIGRGQPDVMLARGGKDQLNALDDLGDAKIHCGPKGEGDIAHIDFENQKAEVNPLEKAINCDVVDGKGHGYPERGKNFEEEQEEPGPPSSGAEAEAIPTSATLENYFKLEEVAGASATNELGNPGTFRSTGGGSGPTLGVPGALVEEEGAADRAVNLNGSDAFVDLNGQATPAESSSGAYSAAMFVKFGKSPGQQEYLFSSGEESDGVLLYRDPAGRLVFATGSDAGAPRVVSSEVIKDENWHFVVGTLEGQTIQLFVDGFRYKMGYGESVLPKTAGSPQGFLGTGPNHTQFLAGAVDEFATFDGVLTEDEVFAAMASSKAEEPELLMAPEPETSDVDNDGIVDGLDNCREAANSDQADVDGNGIGDACETPDGDGDGVPDPSDSCPASYNPDQTDSNGDGVGDACALLAPTATTEPASNLKGAGATLNAVVEPGGTAATYQFEYGQTSSYGTKVPVTPKSIASGATPVAVSEAITGLAPGMTYHYRVVATNDAGETEGIDREFTTPKRPTAATEPATAVGVTNATLNAVVNPERGATTYQFEYGTTTAYGQKVPASPKAIGEGAAGIQVGEAISGLQANTIFHYRVVATNELGTAKGQDRTFETQAAPITGSELGAMATSEPFDGSSTSLANFGVSFSKLGWADEKGGDATNGWRPNKVFPASSGVSYEPILADTGSGVAAEVTMAVNPAYEERYFSLWLDMSASGGATRSGYELRFTNAGTDMYEVTLSKWQAGVETALAQKSGVSLADGDSLAIVDQGVAVSAWTDTGSGFIQILSAEDSAFSAGTSGLEGAGNFSRLANFKAGVPLAGVPDLGAALADLRVRDALAGSENPLSGMGAWTALAWDNSTSGHNTGHVEGGWGPYDAFATVNGASWQKASFADTGSGDAVAATVAKSPGLVERYFSLWLNAPNPTSAKSGYELRFTYLTSNTYEASLARWQAGVKTLLASEAGVSLAAGSQFALVEKAGMVSAWTKTGAEVSQVLSATDATFKAGFSGLEGAGNVTRLTKFQAGPLSPFGDS